MPRSSPSRLEGLAKSHRMALDPADRRASLMPGPAGWARGAAHGGRGRFRPAWFGRTDEHHAEAWHGHGEARPDGGAWPSDRDLRRDFNAVKADLFGWAGALSRNVAGNAVIDMGQGLAAWGAACQARKHGRAHRKAGFPPVRRRHRQPAFTPSNGRNGIQVAGRSVRLPGIGRVRMREALRFDGDLGGVTVGRTLVGVVHGGHVRNRAGARARPLTGVGKGSIRIYER